MKLKNIVVLTIIVVIIAIGYNTINSDSSSSKEEKIENDLIATLPQNITVCYCLDNYGERRLNNLEVNDLTIERQSTDGKYKSVDCTIELEGDDILITTRVNLSCIQYDDGSWQVESCHELSDPEITPKYQPDESNFIWYIQRYEELYSLTKVDEYVNLEDGEIIHYYTVHDDGFTGNMVICRAEFKNTGIRYHEKEQYYWFISCDVN